jgi:hypothetical protein
MNYSFKQECKVYLVKGSTRTKIEVYPDLSFSQTFDEKPRSVKTLHAQNAVFEDATITKANSANFNFTVLLVKGTDFDIIGDWLTTYTELDESLLTYDIYVDTGVDIFKIRKCLAERGTFQIARDQLVTVNISGSGAQLTRFGASGTAMPGSLAARDANIEPIIPHFNSVELNSVSLSNISSVTIELSNEVQWLEHDNLHSSLYVTGAADTSYPAAFVVSKKVLSGTIMQYLNPGSDPSWWSTNATISIKIGQSGAYFLEVNMPKAVITKRIQPDAVFMQGYDFRLTQTPTQIMKYKEL